jgi:hypothetical protein
MPQTPRTYGEREAARQALDEARSLGEEPPPARTGRPRKRINLEEAAYLWSVGATDEEVAGTLAVSVDTLARRLRNPAFRSAKLAAQARGRASLRRRLWAFALDRLTTAKGEPQPVSQQLQLAALTTLGRHHLGIAERLDVTTDGERLNLNDPAYIIIEHKNRQAMEPSGNGKAANSSSPAVPTAEPAALPAPEDDSEIDEDFEL